MTPIVEDAPAWRTITPEELPVRIMANEAMPLYLQIVSQLKQLIMTGELADGVQLPAVRPLASHLGVNPGTVMQAYRLLAHEGLTVSIRGRGSLVRQLSGRSDDVVERERLLESALTRMVTRARALGFDDPEIHQRLSAMLLSVRAPVPVIFLGVTATHAARYTEELNERFVGAGVQFLPYSVADIQHRSRELLGELRTAYTLVTFAPNVPEVERVLDELGVSAEIIGVRAELSADSRTAIAQMSPDRAYTLVTEKRAVPTILALLDTNEHAGRLSIEVIAGDEKEAIPADRLAQVAAGDNRIIYSFGVREPICALQLPAHRLLELKFELTDGTWAELTARWGRLPTPGIPTWRRELSRAGAEGGVR